MKPKKTINISNEDFYKHYLQTKRFLLKIFAEPINTRDFKETITLIKQYKERYFYIFNRLSDLDKIEFYSNTQTHINKILNAQTESKYFEVLTNLLKEIESHYLQFKNPVEELEPQQIEKNAKVEISKNEYIDVFTNDLGQTLFFELHNIYKDKKYHLANYSFLFYALEKDYLVCNGTDFIKFLSKFDINIDKIDSRQSGTINNKTPLFNSVLTKFLDNIS